MSTTPILFREFSAALLSSYRSARRRPTTIGRLTQLTGELGRVLGPAATTADLTTAAMTAWIDRFCVDRCPNTVIGYLGYMRAICAAAIEDGRLERQPAWRRLRPRSQVASKSRHVAWLDVSRLLDHLRVQSLAGDWKDRRLYALTAMVAYTGLRRDEALFLRTSDVDLVAGFVWLESIPERPLKVPSAGQPVPIAAELAEVLAVYRSGLGTDPSWLFPGAKGRSAWHGGSHGRRPIDQLRAAATAVGIVDIGWHSLRHSWATHAESRWGLPEAVIQRVLRHTTPATTRRYRHADLANLASVADRVSYRE